MMKKDLIGKDVTWEEVVEAYPDRWVVMQNCECDDCLGIIHGVLLAVCKDVDLGDTIHSLSQKGFKKRIRAERTTLVPGIEEFI